MERLKKRIMIFVREHEQVTIDQVVDFFKIDKSAITGIMKKLLNDENAIEKLGSKPPFYFKLKKKHNDKFITIKQIKDEQAHNLKKLKNMMSK